MPSVVLHHLFVSPGHNYFGHHGRPPGENPMIAVSTGMCRAGKGIEGDRFFEYRPDYKGQVTLFSWEVLTAAKRHFRVPELAASAVRRNVLIEGVDLNTLIGVRFTLGEAEFLGTEEAKPCYWMDTAVAPGAEAWLRGQGGLRVRVLSDGLLRVGQSELIISEPAGRSAAAGSTALAK